MKFNSCIGIRQVAYNGPGISYGFADTKEGSFLEKSGKSSEEPKSPERGQALWTFLTNHAHALIVLARDPEMTIRDLAEAIGITERAVHKIIGELEDEGYLTRERVGRNNQYKLSLDLPLRHPIESHRSVGDIIRLINET